MQADNTLTGDIFGDMVLEQAIADKTAMVEAEMAMAAQAEIDSYGINGPKDVQAAEGSEEDEDPDFAMDEEEERMLRQMTLERIEAARAEHTENRENIVRGHGTYNEITEQEFLPTVTSTDYVICAFFHKDFERCKIVDKHMFLICKQHVEARFVRIDAEKCPFFVQKLQIQMLPTVILFENGVAIDRITGFDELGGEDDFPTINMVRRLVKGGVLIPKNKSESGQMMINRGRDRDSDGDSDD
mmetsp:Transcript_7429/g.10540  ORF Transcript_7429/g.10540 Transcript_7429/m.10540 type:complete len:243 (+) Transcript_7429:88-816(+)|eukprot:Macronucleus_1492.p3 GENE.Macronucleus_1492~~Macronucleus_1492.p3  ORF type:complete len:243 (+),score=105.44 Macronucleus_1492:1-729(+)